MDARRGCSGSSRQWAAPAPGEPFRFGGCVRPAATACAQSKSRLARSRKRSRRRRRHLVGLNSLDFLVEGDGFALIEINPAARGDPRHFRRSRRHPLRRRMSTHAGGSCPKRPLEFEGAAAATIVYAPRAIASMPALDWPEWAADRPRPTDCAAACMIRSVPLKPALRTRRARGRSSTSGPPVCWTVFLAMEGKRLSETALSINTLTGHLVDRLIADARDFARFGLERRAGRDRHRRAARPRAAASTRVCAWPKSASAASDTVDTCTRPTSSPRWPFELSVRTSDPVDRLPRQPICRLGALAWRGQGGLFRAWLGPRPRACA